MVSRHSVRCDSCGSVMVPRKSVEEADALATDMHFERHALPGGERSDICSECVRLRDEAEAKFVSEGGQAHVNLMGR